MAFTAEEEATLIALGFRPPEKGAEGQPENRLSQFLDALIGDDDEPDDTPLEPVADGANGAEPPNTTPSANGRTPLPDPEPKQSKPGRDERGKFARGNRIARGNPHARRLAKLREAVLAVADERAIRCVISRLQQAEAGCVASAKLFLSYALGLPRKVVNPDTLDHEEWQHVLAAPSRSELSERLIDTVPVEDALSIVEGYLAQTTTDERWENRITLFVKNVMEARSKKGPVKLP
jgi:hypothetical protein